VAGKAVPEYSEAPQPKLVSQPDIFATASLQSNKRKVIAEF